jgi:2-polyprenyl-6-methoxyphenol hydroxylase-like FAD-dependent oxidoreductase
MIYYPLFPHGCPATPDIEFPVLIVGGSLVGLSTALLLGHHCIRALAFERHLGTAIHPRAAQICQRTMEVFRTVGVEQIVRDRSDEQFVQDGAILAVESLAGAEIEHYIAILNAGVTDISRCRRCFISQSLLEPLLKARVQELGSDLLFGTEMVSFEQDTDGVTAIVGDRNSGKKTTVRAIHGRRRTGPAAMSASGWESTWRATAPFRRASRSISAPMASR